MRKLLERMHVIDANAAAFEGVITPDMPSSMWDACSTPMRLDAY